MPVMHFDLLEILRSLGPLAMIVTIAIVFAESGLFFGFFLPGDSLLFTAGVLASQGMMNIYVLAIGWVVAAVLGDSVGYWFGHKFGRKLFTKEDSFFFNKQHLVRAEKFYEKHGKKTIILARFVPAVRTFAPIVAGMANMHYDTFLSYNVIGGFFWAMGMTIGGYFLGSMIPPEKVDSYLLPIIITIVTLSVLPAVWHMVQEKLESQKKTGN